MFWYARPGDDAMFWYASPGAVAMFWYARPGAVAMFSYARPGHSGDVAQEGRSAGDVHAPQLTRAQQ